MKNILFNTHDIVLAACVLFCLFFAVCHGCGRVFAQSPRNLLTVFFVLNACVAFDTLIFWGDAVKYAAFNLTPWLLMLFSFASFAVGPFLYWFFRSLYTPDFTLKPRDYWQLLPALAVIPYIYWACLCYPLEQQHSLILDRSILSDERAHFLAFLTLKKLIPVIYGVKCLVLAYRTSWFAGLQSAHLRNLIALHMGFVLLWCWSLGTHMLGQWVPLGLSDQLGIMGNYLTLALLIVIWLERVRYEAPAPPPYSDCLIVSPSSQSSQSSQPEVFADPATDLTALSEEIQAFVLAQCPYLNSQLTLERFARLMNMPARQVSSAINRCFNQNFQEYINSFRVERAKHFLQDTYCHDTIVEIAHNSGFNSKATFNRLFKNSVGVTPSEYRQGFMHESQAGIL